MPRHCCHICKGHRCIYAYACAHRCLHLRSSFLVLCRLILNIHFSNIVPLIYAIGQWDMGRNSSYEPSGAMSASCAGQLGPDTSKPLMVKLILGNKKMRDRTPRISTSERAEPEEQNFSSNNGKARSRALESRPSDSTAKTSKPSAIPGDSRSQ